MHKISLGFRFWGCSAFLVLSAASQATITLTFNPNAFQYAASESFENGVTTAFSPGSTVTLGTGTVTGQSILNGQGVLVKASTTIGGQTYASIYSPSVPIVPNSHTWALGSNLSQAGVYADGGVQAFGIENSTASGKSASVIINFSQAETYFGGYFAAAVVSGATTAKVTFQFYNGTNLVGTFAPSTLTIPISTTNPYPLDGLAFTAGGTTKFTSVTISGVAVAMDSLRVDSQVVPVPEPASFAALGFGLLLLRRRKRG
jgi:hypothetical protein